jgi:Mn-dependent DtxR family transcriptional regulator
MQSSTMEINSAVQLLEWCTKFLTEYPSSKGFERAVVDARELAKSLDVEPSSVEKRLRRKKRMFNYEGNDNVSSIPK